MALPLQLLDQAEMPQAGGYLTAASPDLAG